MFLTITNIQNVSIKLCCPKRRTADKPQNSIRKKKETKKGLKKDFLKRGKWKVWVYETY